MNKEQAIDALRRASEIESLVINLYRDLFQETDPELKPTFQKGLATLLDTISQTIHKSAYTRFPELVPEELRPKDGGLPYQFRDR